MLPPDKLVEPLYERETDNAPGAFYVIKDQCIICGTPPLAAPKNVTWSKQTLSGGRKNCPSHCRVERQPETPEEIDQLIKAACVSCVQAIRYCGTDPIILQKFVEAHAEGLCDVLSIKRPE
jgi:Na+-translocating ferredoxin:NAD+ oxidoreductase RNF subunit RnfB